jgi:hypothetical protein
MARYKATIIITVPDSDNQSTNLQYIAKLYDGLGFKHAVRARLAMGYTPLEDIRDDIQTRLIQELKHELKERTATYELVSWEQLAS